MSKDQGWTIGVRPKASGPTYKVTKIIPLNGKGFSVLAPYHGARSGFLAKVPVDPALSGELQYSLNDFVRFTAEDQVKLSYHTDGFAQFSGVDTGKIISGRDPDTGIPKGLGLLTRPLASPVWSGPSVAVTIWGLDDFDELAPTESGLLFEEKDFYYRDCAVDQEMAWIISIYVLPGSVVLPLRNEGGQSVLNASLERLNGGLLSVIQMKVIRLESEKVNLGIFVNCISLRFPKPSGWIINGPGDFTAEEKGSVLMAYYPRHPSMAGQARSLDRPPSKTAL